MESPNHLIIVRGDVATATSRTTSLVGRGITALNGQRQAALLAEAQQSRYQAARAVFDRQCGNTSKTVFTEEEAQALYTAYCTLRELADAGYMRACYPVARFLRGGWRILPRAKASRGALSTDRIERVKFQVRSHALSIYQDHDLDTLVTDGPVDLARVIGWCREHYPAAIQASKTPPERLPLTDWGKSLDYENIALAWLNSPDSPDESEVWHDIGAIYRIGYPANDPERAFACFVVAADHGYAPAQCSLGRIFQNGRGLEQGDTEAVRRSELSTNHRTALELFDHHLTYPKRGEDVERDDDEATRWYRQSADRGNARAQGAVGWMFENGRGVKRDDAEAVRWYRQSADLGNARAQNNLGWMYENGRGVELSEAEAVRWYELSAKQGNALAQCNLGLMYENGRGVERDDAEAVRWYRLSAHQGNDRAEHNLGWMYENGRGLEVDDTEAVRWYELSAHQGNASALCNLGWRHANGLGVERDDAESVRLFLPSARQGDASAQSNVGWMYETGRGVERDYAEAVRWYQFSARQGNDQAQYNLGLAYELGRGVTQDLSQAQYWYQKSADQNHADAMGRLTLLLKEKLAPRNCD